MYPSLHRDLQRQEVRRWLFWPKTGTGYSPRKGSVWLMGTQAWRVPQAGSWSSRALFFEHPWARVIWPTHTAPLGSTRVRVQPWRRWAPRRRDDRCSLPSNQPSSSSPPPLRGRGGGADKQKQQSHPGPVPRHGGGRDGEANLLGLLETWGLSNSTVCTHLNFPLFYFFFPKNNLSCLVQFEPDWTGDWRCPKR